MDTPIYQDPHQTQEKPKLGFWQKLGGGALTIAVVIHVILGIVGGFWIFQIIRELYSRSRAPREVCAL